MPFSDRNIPDADGGQGHIPKIPLPDPTIYAPEKPLKFPFPPGSIPGPPKGMTFPPRQGLPIQQPPPVRPPWLGPAPVQNDLSDYPTRPPDPETPRWDFQEPYEAPEIPQSLQHYDIDELDRIPREEIDKFPPNIQEHFKQLFPNKWKFGEIDPDRYITQSGNQTPPVT